MKGPLRCREAAGSGFVIVYMIGTKVPRKGKLKVNNEFSPLVSVRMQGDTFLCDVVFVFCSF